MSHSRVLLRISAIRSHIPAFSRTQSRLFRSAAVKMAPLPKTMKAVEIDETGGVEVLKYRDVPVPQPKEGQVLMKNEFAGVNFIDT
jgi:hypothetical protein